ncbi:MAG: HAMP domain-containing histidine kinase [Ruminococcus sp.]|jgi:signal transduction histidine kinase|nr:HAMP domain-containing histidine kinase [Ruminococcus sp.]
MINFLKNKKKAQSENNSARDANHFTGKARSVRHTVWIYFAIFISGILALLWLIFVVSMETNYKTEKTKQFIDTAEFILQGLSDSTLTTDNLDSTAYSNEMCILVQDRYGAAVYSFDMMAEKCLIHGGPLTIFQLADYRLKALENPSGYYYTEVANHRFNVNTLLFVTVIGNKNNPDGYIFMNTSLVPLESTAGIIRSQILFISILLLILGIGISYILARLIEAPLLSLKKSAEKFGRGNFNVVFEGRGYAETEMLAQTLNLAAKEVSKVDKLRRDLVANVSHDLRTPLTMIKAYAEMIRDLSGDNPAKRAEHLDIIIGESDRLASLVNDILDLSKLESGVNALNVTEFDLTERIYDIMNRYRILSESQGYKFYVSCLPKFIIKGDIIKTEQVIYNLINNAVNYTGEDKSVYVVLRADGENAARLEITDTGEGIDAETLPLIFDRYYRSDKATREVIGSGLGLSIVAQILKLHGFKYGVESIKGIGSTFWIKIQSTDYRIQNTEQKFR